MKSKEKKYKIKLTLKNIIYFLFGAIILFYIITFYNLYFGVNKSIATEIAVAPENTKISQAEKIDIEEIINQNSKPGFKEEVLEKEETLEYITTYKQNSNIPKGVSYVTKEGRNGLQIVTIKRTYQDGNLISETQEASKVTKASLNKEIVIGQGKTTSNKTVKVGDTVYVTSDILAVMSSPSEDAKKTETLGTDEPLEVQDIQNSWYKISYKGNRSGWLKQECTTYLEPGYNEEDEILKNSNNYTSNNSQNSNKNTNTGKATLSFNMNLNTPSGLSLEEFQKVLTDSKDKNKIFENNAKYFYYIEKQYNINGLFVAAVAIHESGWGTSKIAKEKYNLFGYGAYDSSPYNSAYNFTDYSESIDLLARVFVKYYLNPKGTNIYGGEKAVGTYYKGPTLTGVNTYYASDKNWANSVYKHMQYLYGKI